MSTAVGRLRLPEPASPAGARRSLQWRVLTLVTIGMAVTLAMFTASNVLSANQGTRRLLDERRALAAAIADHADYVVREGLRSLDDLSAAEGFDLEDGNPVPEREALRRASFASMFNGGLYVADRDGVLLSVEPASAPASGMNIRNRPQVMAALAGGRPAVSGFATATAGHEPVVSMAIPVRNRSGQVVGVIGGDIRLNGAALTEIIGSAVLAETAYAQLVDSGGVILASTREEQLLRTSDHADQMAGILDRGRTVSTTCHSCHAGSSPGDNAVVDEVMAVAPLQMAPWAVIIRQPESDALASGGLFNSRLTWFSLPAFAVGLLFAWAIVRSIVRPVRTLTAAADRVAAGDLSQPVPAMGKDEIGGLARAFETMRVRLSAALEAGDRWAAELEARVRERTGELEASRDHLRRVADENASLNEELKRRDAARTELMGKVIAAQEEERRRIARELHDETSQALTVLVMGMETAGAASPPGELEGKFTGLKQLAVDTLDGVHRLIYDLRPSVLDDLGLVPGLRWYAERRLLPQGVRVSVMASGQERRLPAEVETALFRIGQEAISNIARHSGAGNAFVNVTFEGQAVLLEVEDDGQGFDVNAASTAAERHRGGWGLLGIRERAALLGGSAAIESEPGGGTRVLVRVPVAGGLP